MNATPECCKPTGYGLFGFRVRWIPRPRIKSTIAANTGGGSTVCKDDKDGVGMEQLHLSGKMGDSEVWSDGQDEDGEGAVVCSVFYPLSPFLQFCCFFGCSLASSYLLFFVSCAFPVSFFGAILISEC